MEPYRFYLLNVNDQVGASRDAPFTTDALAVAHAKRLLVAQTCSGIEVWQAGRFLYHESNIPIPHAPRAPDHDVALPK